jgi:hypothetical protein
MPTDPHLLPELPRPGQHVRWRNPQQARAWGWVDLFGPGPFEVVGTVFRSDAIRATGIFLRTRLGEREVPEVWLTLDDEAQGGSTASGKQSADR